MKISFLVCILTAAMMPCRLQAIIAADAFSEGTRRLMTAYAERILHKNPWGTFTNILIKTFTRKILC